MKMALIIMWILVQVSGEEEEDITLTHQKRVNSSQVKLNPEDEDFLEEQGKKFTINMPAISLKKVDKNVKENFRTIKKPLGFDGLIVVQNEMVEDHDSILKPIARVLIRRKHPKTKVVEDADGYEKNLIEIPSIYNSKDIINSDAELNNRFILKKLQESADNLKEFVRKKPQRTRAPKIFLPKRKIIRKGGLLASNYFTSLTTEDFSADVPVGEANIEPTISSNVETVAMDNMYYKKYKKPVHKEISAVTRHSKIIRRNKEKLKKNKTRTNLKNSSSSDWNSKDYRTSISPRRHRSTRRKQISKVESPNSFEYISSDFNSLTKIPDILNSMVDQIGDKGSFNLRNLLNPPSTTPFQLDRGLFANRLDYVKEQLESLVTSKMSLYDKNLAVSMYKSGKPPDGRCSCSQTETLPNDRKSSSKSSCQTEQAEGTEVSKARSTSEVTPNSDRILTTCTRIYKDVSESSPPVTAELHKQISSRSQLNSKVSESSSSGMLATERLITSNLPSSSTNPSDDKMKVVSPAEKEEHKLTISSREKVTSADMPFRTVCFEIKAIDISLSSPTQNTNSSVAEKSLSTAKYVQATENATKEVIYNGTTVTYGSTEYKTSTPKKSAELSFKDKAEYISTETTAKVPHTSCLGVTETNEVKVINTETTICTTVSQATTLTTEAKPTTLITETEATTLSTELSEVTEGLTRPNQTACTSSRLNQSIETTCFAITSLQCSASETLTASKSTSMSRMADSKAVRTTKCTCEPYTTETYLRTRRSTNCHRTSEYTEEISSEITRTSRKPRPTNDIESSTAETCRTRKPSRRTIATFIDDYVEDTTRPNKRTTCRQRNSTEPTAGNFRRTTRKARSTKCTSKTTAEISITPKRTTTEYYDEADDDYFSSTTREPKKRRRSTFHRPPDKTIRIVFTVEWPEWRSTKTPGTQAVEKSKERKSTQDENYEDENYYEDEDEITTTEADTYFESEKPDIKNLNPDCYIEDGYYDTRPVQYFEKEKSKKFNASFESLNKHSVYDKPQINMTFIVHKQRQKDHRSTKVNVPKMSVKATVRKKIIPIYEPYTYLRKLKQQAATIGRDSASKVKPASDKLANMIDPECYDNLPLSWRNGYKFTAKDKIDKSQEPGILSINYDNEGEKSLFIEAINMLGNATEIYSNSESPQETQTQKADVQPIVRHKSNPLRSSSERNVVLGVFPPMKIVNRGKKKIAETNPITEATLSEELDGQDYTEISTSSYDSNINNNCDLETSSYETKLFPPITEMRKKHSRHKATSSTTELLEQISLKSPEEIRQLCIPVYILPGALKQLHPTSLKCLFIDTPGIQDCTSPVTLTPVKSTRDVPARESSNTCPVSTGPTSELNSDQSGFMKANQFLTKTTIEQDPMEISTVETEKTASGLCRSIYDNPVPKETTEAHSDSTECLSVPQSTPRGTLLGNTKDVPEERFTTESCSLAVQGSSTGTISMTPLLDNSDLDKVILQKEQDGKLLIFTVCMGPVTGGCRSCTPTSKKKKSTCSKIALTTTKKYKKKKKYDKSTSAEELMHGEEDDEVELKCNIFKNKKLTIIPVDSTEENEAMVDNKKIQVQNVIKHLSEPSKPFILLPYSDPHQMELYLPPINPYIRHQIYPIIPQLQNVCPCASPDHARHFYKNQREGFSRGKILVNGAGLPDGLYSIDDLKKLNKTSLLASLLDSGSLFGGTSVDHDHELRRVQKHSQRNNIKGIYLKNEEKPNFSTCGRNSVQKNLQKTIFRDKVRFHKSQNKDTIPNLEGIPKGNHNLKPPWFKSILHRHNLTTVGTNNEATKTLSELSEKLLPRIPIYSSKETINKSQFWKNIWPPISRRYKNADYDNR